MFVKTEAVFRMCGSYVAFHEVNIMCEWVFGDIYFTEGDNIWEHLMTKLGLDFSFKDDPLENQDKELLDKLVREYMSNFIGDYCDMSIMTNVVVELDEKGMPIAAYM